MTTMTAPGQFTLHSRNLGCLPIVNFFLNRIGLADHLANYLPHGDARLRLTPAAVVEVVVRNLVVGRRPAYALGEWAAAFDPGVLGLRAGDAEMLNDDRDGRTLDRLFDADRASLITATVLAVIRDFGVETTQLHNDSTTVTVTGAYPDAGGRDRGGKATPAIRHGHNKDYRPDLKQLLFRTALPPGLVHRVASCGPGTLEADDPVSGRAGLRGCRAAAMRIRGRGALRRQLAHRPQRVRRARPGPDGGPTAPR